jgi:hypothetical protein
LKESIGSVVLVSPSISLISNAIVALGACALLDATSILVMVVTISVLMVLLV